MDKATRATHAPEDDVVAQGDGTENEIVSNDRLDMLRMGKTPQLKVCGYDRDITHS